MNIPLFVAVGVAVVTGMLWSHHVLRLRRHTGLSREEFAAHLQTLSVAPEVAFAVYDHFKEFGVWKIFRPSPSDRLEETYQTVDDDVEDNLRVVIQELGYEMPHSGILAEWECPVESLEDVGRFVDWVRTKQVR